MKVFCLTGIFPAVDAEMDRKGQEIAARAGDLGAQRQAVDKRVGL